MTVVRSCQGLNQPLGHVVSGDGGDGRQGGRGPGWGWGGLQHKGPLPLLSPFCHLFLRDLAHLLLSFVWSDVLILKLLLCCIP